MSSLQSHGGSEVTSLQIKVYASAGTVRLAVTPKRVHWHVRAISH